MRDSWERFVHTGELDDRLAEPIRASWIRCRAYGVNPFQEVCTNYLTEQEFAQCIRANEELISLAVPFMQHLYDFVRGSGFLVILCDNRGYLLKVIGDDAPYRDAARIHFVEGANWSEEVMGTNAIGTCLKLNQPIQVYASEHYTVACQSWTCSAAPIHRPDGTLVGALNLSGPLERVHNHTLGMVFSAVKAIENQWCLLEKTRKNELMQRYVESAINSLNESVVILDTDGCIVRVNRTFTRWTEVGEEQLTGRLLEDVCVWKGLRQLAGGEVQVTDKEVTVQIRQSGKRMHLLLNVEPIYSGHGDFMGSLVTLKEMSQVKQFVSHMTDSQAKVTFSDIIGQSPSFLACVQEARLAAQSDATVLLTGESGTGKDLFAQAIHRESKRRHKPFLAINCGAIPRDLLGSELFGYVDGAFTGARKGGSAGKFELADGGTVFLDEVGEMSLEMQVLLLRVLQNREVVRIGGHKVHHVDVRIIAATNKDLFNAVKKGHFREDLYYRLNVIPIRLPSLRERKNDIPLLVQAFCRQLGQRLNRSIDSVSPELMGALVAWPWHGNVRELQNVLERMILRTQSSRLELELLPPEMKIHKHRANIDNPLPLKDEMKKQALLDSIQATHGNYKEAARRLGIARSTLYRQLDRYGLRSQRL